MIKTSDFFRLRRDTQRSTMSKGVQTFNLADNTVTVGKLAVDSVTAAKIDVDQLSAISADLGTITAGTVIGATIQTATSGYRAVMQGSGNPFEYTNGSVTPFRVTTGGSVITTSLSIDDGTDVIGSVGTVGAVSDLIIQTSEATAAIILRTASSGDNIELDSGQSVILDAQGSSNVVRFIVNGTTRMDVTNTGATITGDLSITGALSKGSGTFDIPHPDPNKPDGTRLRHSFVESPTAGDNLYRYQVQTKNKHYQILLPDYFKHLNENPQVWITPVNVLGTFRSECDLETVDIYVSEDGIYNVLVIGTRKDTIAVDHWETKGVEYLKQ